MESHKTLQVLSTRDAYLGCWSSDTVFIMLLRQPCTSLVNCLQMQLPPCYIRLHAPELDTLSRKLRTACSHDREDVAQRLRDDSV